MTPVVSVVIPTYNRKELLRRAVESCLQTGEVEVIVVDDGSSDGTRDWIQSLDDERVRPIFQENQGAPSARNHGRREAEGSYVKFLDDDDWLAEGALEQEVAALRESGADVSYGQVVCVNETGQSWIDARPTPLREVEDWISAVTSESLSIHPARFTYRRCLLDGVEWTPDLPVRQDYDFALQVARKQPDSTMVDRVVYYYRQHSGGRISADSQAEETLCAHLDILVRHVRALEREGLATSSRLQATAEKLWSVGRMMAVYDQDRFEQIQDLIHRRVPDFSPRRSNPLLSWVDAVLTPRQTESLLLPFRKIKGAG
jgi:hypothetical protein